MAVDIDYSPPTRTTYLLATPRDLPGDTEYAIAILDGHLTDCASRTGRRILGSAIGYLEDSLRLHLTGAK